MKKIHLFLIILIAFRFALSHAQQDQFRGRPERFWDRPENLRGRQEKSRGRPENFQGTAEKSNAQPDKPYGRQKISRGGQGESHAAQQNDSQGAANVKHRPERPRLRQEYSSGHRKKSPAHLSGHVLDQQGNHIPYASIVVKGTTLGTTTDESGHYHLEGLPEGSWVIRASFLGYKPREQSVSLEAGGNKEIPFTLEKDVLGMEEIVVTGNRHETYRKDASTIVNTLTPKQYQATQSISVVEGLNFTPGLRSENNCQNCGFAQIRMNGMEGPYSQILINSRPIFSGLAGVYGLELIPASMIERVEVIRGGGSALYGSNAIAGTINLILKDPINNAYEVGASSNLTGVGMNSSPHPSREHVVSFNTSLVSSSNKTGMSMYGFYRDRDPFDANGDSFSELTSIKNTTLGSRLFHRFDNRSKLTGDFFHIRENRRGGDKHDYLPHMAGIAETLDHHITTGAVTYDRFFREKDVWSVFASAQSVKRDAYYGAEESLSDYGYSEDLTYTAGTQYNLEMNNATATLGMEHKGGWLVDKKLGYLDIDNRLFMVRDTVGNRVISDQATSTLGIFGQYGYQLNKLKASLGARLDQYTISDRTGNHENKRGTVVSPRLTLKYDIKEYLQARMSYSRGYRAPQIYDEDLHIETSGARQVIHKNDPDLQQETSNSYMVSLDVNKQLNRISAGFLAEVFHTTLHNAFANEFGEPDENGTVVYTRVNAEKGARVRGVNFELNLVPYEKLRIASGFTFQSSKYEGVREFGMRKFFRTPDDYGYMTVNWKVNRHWGWSSSASYTGKMLVPYFGTDLANPGAGELRETQRFCDLGFKLRYNLDLSGSDCQLYAGVKNLFNAYQHDFDRGIDRDPAYIYGPMTPRTLYAGIRIGNLPRF